MGWLPSGPVRVVTKESTVVFGSLPSQRMVLPVFGNSERTTSVPSGPATFSEDETTQSSNLAHGGVLPISYDVGESINARQCRPWTSKFVLPSTTCGQCTVGLPVQTNQTSNHVLTPSWRFRFSSEVYRQESSPQMETKNGASFDL